MLGVGYSLELPRSWSDFKESSVAVARKYDIHSYFPGIRHTAVPIELALPACADRGVGLQRFNCSPAIFDHGRWLAANLGQRGAAAVSETVSHSVREAAGLSYYCTRQPMHTCGSRMR